MKEIILSQGKVAFVDDGDFEFLNGFKWTFHKGSYSGEREYAVRNPFVEGKRVWVRMHRFIMGLQPGDPRVVDHLDENGLNNTRANLEVITLGENTRRSLARKKKLTEPFL